MNDTIFIQLAIVLGLSAVLGFFVRSLRLPLLIAYLIVGVLLSFLQLFDLGTSVALTFLPEIGMAFVLFFVGMELDLKEIGNLGKPILAAGLGQIIISILAGSVIASHFGFGVTESLLLGVGLSFSSTIVVVKLLLEKKDVSSLYGKLSIGILLLEDLVAILLLMGMSVSSSVLHLGLQNSLPILTLFFKGALLLALALGLARYVLSRLFNAVAQSAELLFLSALAWCFIFISVSLLLGFSVVIGAFLAGVALANSPFHYEIQGKVKPLRDFFTTLFFVYLGSQVAFEQVSSVLPLILAFTVYAFIAKPIIFLLILGAFGFRKHTIFQTALNMSQISEFSLIILVIGLKMGIVRQEALTAMALTGVISIIASSILISAARNIYPWLRPFIGFFEHTNFTHQTEAKAVDLNREDHVILVGAHRMGGEIIRFLKREGIPLLVLDFNPKVIEGLMAEKVHAFYGDIGDPEILEFLNLPQAKLIISTAQDLSDNLTLLAEVKRKRIRAAVVTRASSVGEAKVLYEAGSDYVLIPEIVAGDFLSAGLKTHWPSVEFLKDRAEVELHKLSKNHLAMD